jgi:hypothetical protein
MKIAYRARDIIEAHIVAGMLRAEGLDCHVGGHYLQGAIGDLAPLDFATVLVSDEDAAAASSCIADYEASCDPTPLSVPPLPDASGSLA